MNEQKRTKDIEIWHKLTVTRGKREERLWGKEGEGSSQ